MKRKRSRPPWRKESRRDPHESPPALCPKKGSKLRTLHPPMVLRRYRILSTLLLQKSRPSPETGLPPPSLRACVPQIGAERRKRVSSKTIKPLRSWTNRQIPLPIAWTRQRSKMMRMLLPQKLLAMAQVRPRGRSSTLRLKKNHVLGLLCLLHRLQSQTRILPVSRLVGYVFQ